jgi:tRNA dimethylallyltransferase
VKNPIIILSGPTASGKTAISFSVAKEFNCEIICADSMTVYRGMDIGTDKPTMDKTTNKEGEHYVIRGISHHMLNLYSPDEEFNVSIFKKLAEEKIKEIRERGKIPMLVGGSAMYIDSVAYNYTIPAVGPDITLRNELEKKSCAELYSELVSLDPDCEWTIDAHNKRRIIRALEIVKKTGQSPCSQKSREKLPDNVLYLSVSRPREDLYLDINRRVDEMMKRGFLSEAKKLFKKYDHNTAMQAAGYKQLVAYLDGELTFEEAVEKTKQAHRNFAKKQLTWLKRNPDITWVDDEKEAILAIQKFLR